MPNRLKAVRTEKQCRMWELAARCGVSASMLSAIERYDYSPRDLTKFRIAGGLEVEVGAIWPDMAWPGMEPLTDTNTATIGGKNDHE